MKRNEKILRALVVAMVMTCMWLTGSAQVLRDADYNSVGRISPNGMVRDEGSISVGSFDADGTIRDRAGNVLGTIRRLEIFDAEGVRVGYINSDGAVRAGDSSELGKISLSDGRVTDAEGRVLGFARGIRVDWIACYYFFDFFGLKR